MHDNSFHITVLGAGSWGTALAHHLRKDTHPKKNLEVTIWGRDVEVLSNISEKQQNPRYFPGLQLASGIRGEADLKKALEKAKLVIIALPSASVREIGNLVKPFIMQECFVVSTTKGLEQGTLKPMSAVLAEELGHPSRIAVLSGPSFALEIIRGLPTAVTVAASDLQQGKHIAGFFHYDNLRVYTSCDVKGVEFGGVIKNVIALASGVVEGAGMGANARAALLTRGLAEMQRLIVALGGEAQTVIGLSGLGDLLLTATGDLSRNRQVGLRLGRGEKLGDILSSMDQVAEGVHAAPKVLALAKQKNVSMPIAEQVVKVLAEKSSITEAVTALLSRAPGIEVGTRTVHKAK